MRLERESSRVRSRITEELKAGSKREEGRRDPHTQGLGIGKEPETHREFWIKSFQPVSQESLKLISVREGVNVYVLKDLVKNYVFKAVVNREN